MKRHLFTLCFLLLTLASAPLSAQAPAPQTGGQNTPQTVPQTDETPAARTVTFTFAPGSDLFTLLGNEAQLTELYALIDRHRAAISARRLPLRVDGYCASLPTPAENLRTAYLRASRVKSELITQKGLTEDDFITGNYARAYLDRHPDIVVVTLRIPAPEKPAPTEAARKDPQPADNNPPAEPAPRPEKTAADKAAAEAADKAAAEAADKAATEAAEQAAAEAAKQAAADKAASEAANTAAPYTFALRTNLLYDAFLLPTLGIEWRITDRVGVKLDGSLSRWGGATGKVQKTWFLSPEVRWYLLSDKRFYLGASANYGEYNIYGYPLGNLLLRDDTGYQGNLWNAGLTLGYQLRLCRALSLDFNLGLGYTRSAYDSFRLIDRTRVYRHRDRTKHFWGPTQAGISLVWTINGKQ